MTKNAIDYKTLYELVDNRTAQIMTRFDALDCRVGVIERWKDKATTYVAVMVGIVTLGWTLAVDWVKKALHLDV